MAKVSEEELVSWMEAYQRGDRTAFRNLYNHLARRLRGYLISLSFDPVLAEDLLQETFLQIHRARASYRSPLPVVPWAFAIARNCFRMEKRAFVRKRGRESGPDGLEALPLESLFEAADRIALRQAVGALREDWREALLLHHLWGFSFRDLAAMLGIGEGAARLRAHRAMTELREQLRS